MKTTVGEILQDIGSQLAYHQSAGVTGYPTSEAIEALLKREPQKGGSQGVQTKASIEPVPAATLTPDPVVKQADVPDIKLQSGSFRELESEILTCTGCALAESRLLSVPGNGGDRVRLMIVGDRLPVEEGAKLPQTCVFGIEQDRMLGRMLEAIKLPRADVFVTNVIKCGVPSAKQPQAEHVNACYSYLPKQISLLRPEMILAMGMIPARMLLNRSGSLSRLRGRFHSHKGADGKKIPLVATYHPTFLMQNEGMKRATWEDLKLVARQLRLP